MNRKKRTVLALSVVVLALLLAAGSLFQSCKPTESSPTPTQSPVLSFDPKVLTIGVGNRPTSLLFYAVNHYIPRNRFQLKPVVIPDADERWARLAAGELDLNFSTISEFVLGASRTNPGTLVCFTSSSDGCDGIVARKTVSGVDDLKGKRVCVVSGTGPHFFLIKFLNSKAQSTAEVNLVYAYSMNDAYAYLTNGNFIDAAVLTEPYISRAKKAGFTELVSTQDSFSLTEILTASPNALKNRPQDIQQVINAYFNLVDFIKNNPGLAKKLISSRAGVSIDEVDTLLNCVKLKDLEEARAPSKESVVDEMKKIQQVWTIEGLPNADRTLDFDALVNFTFLEKAVVSPAAPLFDDTPTAMPTEPSPVEITETPIESPIESPEVSPSPEESSAPSPTVTPSTTPKASPEATTTASPVVEPVTP